MRVNGSILVTWRNLKSLFEFPDGYCEATKAAKQASYSSDIELTDDEGFLNSETRVLRRPTAMTVTSVQHECLELPNGLEFPIEDDREFMILQQWLQNKANQPKLVSIIRRSFSRRIFKAAKITHLFFL